MISCLLCWPSYPCSSFTPIQIFNIMFVDSDFITQHRNPKCLFWSHAQRVATHRYPCGQKIAAQISFLYIHSSTVFEIHRKSLIQHCERSFRFSKSRQNEQFMAFLTNFCLSTKIVNVARFARNVHETFSMIFKHPDLQVCKIILS